MYRYGIRLSINYAAIRWTARFFSPFGVTSFAVFFFVDQFAFLLSLLFIYLEYFEFALIATSDADQEKLLSMEQPLREMLRLVAQVKIQICKLTFLLTPNVKLIRN